MRLSLGGSKVTPDPVVLTFLANGTFNPQPYIDQGYTNFDVICIGGGGGTGGGVNSTTLRSYGGCGGGGGLHRVRGLLKYLPASCPVVVGNGGSKGNDTTATSGVVGVTDGGPGGASTFNGTTCQASGGTGGYGVRSNALATDPQGWGGYGGCGGQSAAGGGGQQGWTYQTPSSTNVPTGYAGGDGSYIAGIGKGGGGGPGGMAKADGTAYLLAASGGRGSYNLSDPSVYSPGGNAQDGITANTIGGSGGGGKATPLNGLPTLYGSSVPNGAGNKGVVVIRLTAE